jgi:hypothetical protein
MMLLTAGLWGLAGAGAVEASELYSAVRSAKAFPWGRPGELNLGPYLFSVVLRLALGAFAALLCVKSGPLGPAGAAAAGIAAPKLLEQLGRQPSTVGVSPFRSPQARPLRGRGQMPHPSIREDAGEISPASWEEGQLDVPR